MTLEEAKQLVSGDEVFFAGSFYKFAELKEFPHGTAIGIYDEPPSKHIDYINPESVRIVSPCHSCQGGGCTVCSGYGRVVY